MRVAVVGSCLTLASFALYLPPAAAEGRQAFAAATVELIGAIEGRTGDEGPALMAALEAMAQALDLWDRDLRSRERAVEAAAGQVPSHALAAMHTQLGWAYLERGRRADALREFDRALAADPRPAIAHLARGRAQLDRPDQALAAFRRSWDLDRTNPVAAYWLVHAALETGRAEGLEGPVETLVAAYRRLATRGADRGRPFLTHSLFRDDAVDSPIFPLVAYEEAFTRLVQRDYDGALAALRASAARDPLVADEALRADAAGQGIAALRQGDAGAAVGPLLQAAGRFPQSSEVRRVLGLAYRAAGRFDEGLAQLDAAVRLAPANERAQVARVLALRDAGQLAAAEHALQEALAALPSSGALRWTYAALYHQINREEETLEQLEAVPTTGILAGRRHVLAAIGRLHASAARPRAAAERFRLGVRAAPNNASAHMDLAAVHRAQAHNEAALAAYVAVLLIAPDTVEAHTAIGQIHLAADRLEDAVVAFRRAVALDGDRPDARYGLARALRRVGRADEAAAHFEAFRELQQAWIAAQRQMYELHGLARTAAIHEDAGRHEEALQTWQIIVQRDPANTAHHVAFGEALARAGRLEQAIGVLERAAATSTATPRVYGRLAELYAAAGRPADSARAHAEYQRRQGMALLGMAAGHQPAGLPIGAPAP